MNSFTYYTLKCQTDGCRLHGREVPSVARPEVLEAMMGRASYCPGCDKRMTCCETSRGEEVK